MLDAEKAAEGVIRSVKDFVARAVAPLTNHVDELDAKFKEVGKLVNDVHDKSIAHAISEAMVPVEGRIESMEARLTDASHAAITKATEPLTLKMVEVDTRLAEAANTERFRPFLETALDAVRKEGGTVDEKLDGIEKRLEAAGYENVTGAIKPLTDQIDGLHQRLDDVAKSVPSDPAENILNLNENIGATVVRLNGCEKQIESLAALAAGIDPLERKLAGLDEHVRNVVTTIPADQSAEISKAIEAVSKSLVETYALSKRIDGLEPRFEGLAKTAAEVTPITERVIRLETRYEDVRRDAIDAGISKAIEDFAGKEVKPLDDKIGTLEARLEDITKSAEAINPLTNQIEDLSARFNEIGAANDALQERILKSVDVQIVEAVKQLPPPKDGEHGKDGISAYQIAVSKGFSGSEDEWLGSLKGINGIKGDAGESIAGPRGEPGKDSEPVDVALIIKEVVAQIPVPKDGKDGKDAEPISEELVRSEVEKAVAEIPKPKEIPPEVVAEMVSVEVQKAVSAIPKPKDGQDGLAGKDAEPVDVEKIVADVVARVPVPKDGERGPAGESIVGPKGEPGDRGEKGESIAGEAGTKGEAGPSAYQLALEEGFAGTRSQWLASLQGKNGDAGRDGKDGRDAREPRDGKDGEPGRDALHIEVLPTIDTSKSVPRGTFASHNGGLWRAARNTDAGDDLHLCGWQSIVEGFPEIEIDQGDDLRTFTFRAVSSTGRKIEKRFSLPVVIDRGVYKVDRWYEPGDSVSQRGCGWIAQRKTQSVPGTNDDWRMSVKAGRDGKDVALLSPKPPQQVRLK